MAVCAVVMAVGFLWLLTPPLAGIPGAVPAGATVPLPDACDRTLTVVDPASLNRALRDVELTTGDLLCVVEHEGPAAVYAAAAGAPTTHLFNLDSGISAADLGKFGLAAGN